MNKKISTKSAITLSLTSMIGVGIFVKNGPLNILSNFNVFPIICLVIIFLLNLFSFCYVLLKIIPVQNSNSGIIEWSKNFCPSWLHNCFCSFIRHFYHPISIFIFSIYGVSIISGKDYLGLGTTSFISFIVVIGFSVLNLISFKWARRIQMVLWCLVLFPLVLLPAIGFFTSAPQGASNEPAQVNPSNGGGWMIMIAGLPAMLFIYDGFYTVTSLRSKLEEPKKMKYIVGASLLIITLIYIYVITGFHVGDRNSGNFKRFSTIGTAPVVSDFFEILIGCAGLLTLNSMAMSNIPQLESMYNMHRFEDTKKFKSLVFYKKLKEETSFDDRFILWLYLIAKTTLCFVIVWIISLVSKSFDRNKLLEIVDCLADIISVFVFLIIVSAMIGSLKYYKNENALFKFCIIFSSSIIIIALMYLIYSRFDEVANVGSTNSWIKLILMFVIGIGSIAQQAYLSLDKVFKKKDSLIYPRYPKDSLFVLNNK